MSRTGENLGVDLSKLDRAGKVLLPHIADTFGHVRTFLGESDSGDSAFTRPAELGGGSGPTLAAYSALRSTMTKILQDAQENLELAGHALTLTAQAYLASDDSAAAGIRSGYDYDNAHTPRLPSSGR